MGNKVTANLDAAEEKKASLNERSLPESSFQTLSRRNKGLQLAQTTGRIVTSAARQAARYPIPKPRLPAARPITPPPMAPKPNFSANQRFAIAAAGGVAAVSPLLVGDLPVQFFYSLRLQLLKTVFKQSLGTRIANG